MVCHKFYKYQANGNDFVIFDIREEKVCFDKKNISSTCDRRFGIGADGIILFMDHPEYDFEINYFNADGSSSYCGNGSRSAVHLAKYLGLVSKKVIVSH